MACWIGGEAVQFGVLSRNKSRQYSAYPSLETREAVVTSTLRFLFVFATLVGLPWAWRNYKVGRCDLTGAVRLAAVIFVVQLAVWALGASHVQAIPAELTLLAFASFRAVGSAALVFILYSALEPSARRNWPQLLISWTRLLHLRRADPLVWSHVLVGLAMGCLWAVLASGERGLLNVLGWSIREPLIMQRAGDWLLGGGATVAACLSWGMTAVGQGLLFAVLLAVARAVVRKPQWAAILVWLVLLPGVVPRGGHAATSWLFMGIGAAVVGVWAMVRYGLLPLIVAMSVAGMLNAAAFTLRPSAWYLGRSVALLLVVLGAAAYAMVHAGRRATEVGTSGGRSRGPV